MKKNIFMISLAMLALVSCTNDEVIQINKGQKIGFRTAMNTRATVLEQATLSEFYVTALNEKGENYFSDVLFTKGTGIYFTSAQDYYWPDGVLDFYAYYPSATDLNASIIIDNTKKALEGYVPNADIASQYDFITATASGSKENESVAVNFNHQLSQIEVKGFNNNQGYNIYVKGIKIKNAVGKGNFDFVSRAWSLSSDEGDLAEYAIDFENEIALTGDKQSFMAGKGSAMLIPQTCLKWGVEEQGSEPENGDVNDGGEVEPAEETDPNGSYIAFYVRAFTKNADGSDGVRLFPLTGDETYAWVALPIAFKWVAGFKYTYNCDFSDGLGVIAPDNIDPDPDPEDPDSPYVPGEDVYGGKIAVNVTFNQWIYKNNSSDDLYDSYHDVPMGTEDEE